MIRRYIRNVIQLLVLTRVLAAVSHTITPPPPEENPEP